MYSTKKNIQQLISIMEQQGIVEVVISPGSRNMPLAESFASSSLFHCHAVTDERSAGFYAIGLSISLNKPVAVCVTSGSALLNLTSAVSEAYYQQIPLLVISADRPSAWIGQMDGQTLPQCGVFGTLLRKEVSLPEPINETDEWHCNRLINEAILELQHRCGGPVHINVPITEPFFDCSCSELPKERIIYRNQPFKQLWEVSKKPLLIVGQLPTQEAISIYDQLSRLGCPVVCEYLSNLPSQDPFITNSDLILASQQDISCLEPDLVIYMGGHIVSKRLKKWLRTLSIEQCWRIDTTGECCDTFQSLTNIIEEQNLQFLSQLNPKNNTDFLHQWLSISSLYQAKCTNYTFNDFSSLCVTQQFMKRILQNSVLVLANSSAVRYAQLFPLIQGTVVSCNRGVNGIDGSLSTAIGIAQARPLQLVFVLIGDLSFFYDMNCLGIANLPTNLRIILLNNGCGEIFRMLPGLESNERITKYVMAQHNTTAKGWVESVGCRYLSASNKKEMIQVLNSLCQIDDLQQSMVGEFFTTPAVDEKEYKTFYEEIKK